MKKKIIVKINWNVKRALQMAAIAKGTVTCMTSNGLFTTPKVTMKIMGDAADRVEKAYGSRKNGNTGKDEFTNSCNALDVLLHKQADYVSDIANSDETIIHSAGFESTNSVADSARATTLVLNNTPVVTSLVGGGIKVKAPAVAGAKFYSFVLFVDAPFSCTILNGQTTVTGSNAIIISSTKSTVTFKGLPGLKTVNVAVVAYNANGDSGFSPVATGATLP